MRELERLDVYIGNTRAGILTRDAQDHYHFTYDPTWLNHAQRFPLSWNMPLHNETQRGSHIRHFFANLLPEGEVRELIARRFHTSPHNDFALLKHIGGECAGALCITPPTSDNTPTQHANDTEYRALSVRELESYIKQSATRPLLASIDEIRLSLAGVQEKIPLHIRNGSMYLPLGSAASSAILKPDSLRFPGLITNEYYCMQLAQRLGLTVAQTELWSGEAQHALIVYRFDRTEGSDGCVHRIHQIDACQALGLSTSQKYENEGGPTVQQCASLIDAHSMEPALDKQRLLQWIIFNVVIGNADAHGKNIAWLIEPHGAALAPHYDLNATMIYPELSERFAMKIGGQYERKYISRRHWEALAEELQIRPTYVLEQVASMMDNVMNQAQPLLHTLQSSSRPIPHLDTCERITEFIAGNVKRLR